MSDPTRIDYDTLAGAFAAHRDAHPGVLRRLLETGGVSSATRVLDVGCGTGNYLVALHGLTGCAATGIDPSPEMLARAAARSSAIAWIPGTAETLPVPDDAFDLIFTVDVIHHVGDRDAFFREARRVLSLGGRICIATDSHQDIARRRPLSSHFPETVPYELTRYPAIETLQTEMTAAGFAALPVEHVEFAYDLTDIAPYRDRAFSALHLIPDDVFAAGLARLERDLARGPVPALRLYTFLWATAQPVPG